ncbi:MAG: class III poly(R)-hydroxyalkanoic acid synthase subunit PhaC [Gammaproteobacteria bacterium]|nr:class III poly(R)-hydroxyalkanoic acid synthase subunit PhaC [Gammaproteobacteria bacterium]
MPSSMQLPANLMEYNQQLQRCIEAMGGLDKVETGGTPRDTVYRENKLVLYRYRAQKKSHTKRIPLLIVYALVNRPYMMDLQPDRSTIRGLLDAGLDVFMIDWGYPESSDRLLGLDDYINGYIDHCVDHICETLKIKKLNVLGVCQGGTFSLCYVALQPAKISNLVTMVTPVDFHTPDNLLARMVKRVDVDSLVDAFGNVPGELLNWLFLSLKPFRLTTQKYVNLLDIMDNKQKLENFVRMEKWIADSPDQAGEAFRQFIGDFFQENKLITGGLKIGDHAVDLKKIKHPVLNVFASEDHLVPPAASKALKSQVGSDDYSELEFRGGHIGIYVSSRAQDQIPAAIGDWLTARS